MILETAPSNIALIKYMGKEAENIPTNASLSYSLNHLETKVKLEAIDSEQDRWLALPSDYSIQLNEASQSRFLNFFAQLKSDFGIEASYQISSANNFPSDCGLASSASSFAALTLAAYRLACAQGNQKFFDRGFTGELDLDRRFLSSYSRKGSGSSCRSFYPEWSVWEGDSAVSVEFPYKNLLHFAVIVEAEKKEVSSSAAHQRVKTSLLMEGRTKRANTRLNFLMDAFKEKNWQQAFEICWAEFWDMHSLFETSQPSFGYMNSASVQVLEYCKSYWKIHSDGPLVTMDAGPNVHLLFREDQTKSYQEMQSYLGKDFALWTKEGRRGKEL